MQPLQSSCGVTAAETPHRLVGRAPSQQCLQSSCGVAAAETRTRTWRSRRRITTFNLAAALQPQKPRSIGHVVKARPATAFNLAAALRPQKLAIVFRSHGLCGLKLLCEHHDVKEQPLANSCVVKFLWASSSALFGLRARVVTSTGACGARDLITRDGVRPVARNKLPRRSRWHFSRNCKPPANRELSLLPARREM